MTHLIENDTDQKKKKSGLSPLRHPYLRPVAHSQGQRTGLPWKAILTARTSRASAFAGVVSATLCPWSGLDGFLLV